MAIICKHRDFYCPLESRIMMYIMTGGPVCNDGWRAAYAPAHDAALPRPDARIRVPAAGLRSANLRPTAGSQVHRMPLLYHNIT